MGIDRRSFVAMATVFLPLFAGTAYADAEAVYRWDIVRLSLTGMSPTINPGGTGSALANDGSMITVTGSGTFETGDDDVTGGGTWETTAPNGTVTGHGAYTVTALVRFELAPGHQTNGLLDTIGDGTLTDNRAGLAILRIRYGDGSRGILVISCHLNGNPPPQGPDAAPASIFEGITASKGYTDYWNRVPPAGTPATANANRTLFHLLKRDD
jgi:hypothetical protein